MKVANRREQILQAVQQGMSELADICSRFDVSEATARRDLQVLQQEGRLLRTYGGAVPHPIQHEPEEPLETRQSHNHATKTEIARKAVGMVADGDTIFIDAGTTAEAFAREVQPDMQVRICTNNLLVMQTLAHRRVPVSLLGGDLRVGSMSVFGSLADLALDRLTFDKVFTSADGVDAELGLCEGSAEQSWFKEKLFRRTREIFVMATSEKLGRRSQMHWTPLHQPWTLITDRRSSAQQLKEFSATPSVKLVVV